MLRRRRGEQRGSVSVMAGGFSRLHLAVCVCVGGDTGVILEESHNRNPELCLTRLLQQMDGQRLAS